MSKGSVSAPDWTARASCRLLIGRLGCRPVSGGVSAALSAGTCPDMPGHAQECLNTPDLALTFHPDLTLTFHPGLALTFHPDLALTFH